MQMNNEQLQLEFHDIMNLEKKEKQQAETLPSIISNIFAK
jgi:hypothetical protein